ncbi:peptide/nickel transport system permease protein [Saccharothrix tamanrassetensis]|uniref:Peptide/nickel transport system permease protein n=1 Tax=Saccharothrix tamanrassetensis TaxID=1051531 RepID=A0A841CDC4_9PSEU|nr:ABC transporter permease [Saccharothrix tamanrassetensis]MBB5953756.1 peptide/nickel transport system permease protein [Saccharothrix tamanrassetensis]
MTALKFLARRVAATAATLFAVAVVLFAASEVLPGDAATASLDPDATLEDVARERAALGLDRPWPVRFAEWAFAALRLDLGTSAVSRQPVVEIVAEPLGATALLVGVTAAVTVPLAMAVGLISGLRRGGRADRALSAFSVVAVSIPQFVTAGLLVLVFADLVPVLPAISLPPLGGTPLDRPEVLVLPVAALTLFGASWAGRIVRAAVIDADGMPHVEAARLAGLPERVVVFRHLLPAALPPCAHTFAWLLSGLFGGTAVVEIVFNYPGLSQTLVAAVRKHDTAVLEGVGLLLAAIILVSFVLADLLVMAVDPRLRAAAR